MDKTELRDLIAMHALQGILANPHNKNITANMAVRQAYVVADTALVERSSHRR
jgi:hypothetical protein